MSRSSAGFASETKKLTVFFCYAHTDQEFRDELDRHLGFLKRAGFLETWHDRCIGPGQDWEREVALELGLADIVLLLISPDFACSDYCWDVEMCRALERHERGEALVIPVLVRPATGWELTPIGKLQSLPRNARPVTRWRSRDEAYQCIAQSLKDVILNWSDETDYARPDWIHWRLKLEGRPEGYSKTRVRTITAILRESANSQKLDYVDLFPGSVDLEFRSTQPVFETLAGLHAKGKLQRRLNVKILGLSVVPGAVLRIVSRVVDGEFKSSIQYLPEVFGGRTLDDGFPPLVGGIAFPLQNPMQIGFSLLSDSTLEQPTAEEQSELQMRLGRYLNTFLVLTGDHVNVTLTPTDDYCGLSKLLRHTELGRDMLAQDIVLKHTAACQLHPSTAHGAVFWRELDRVAAESPVLESCFRVWIVPDGAAVREKTIDDQGHVSIEKLGLKVMCEADYDTLQQYGALGKRRAARPGPSGHDEQVVTLFKELIVPEIQREVSTGPRFGHLRQILSVLVIAKWIMESQLGKVLERAGFLGSNDPAKYGLDTVDDEVVLFMKRLYLQMFGEGVWQQTRTRVDLENNVAEKRLFVAGGIELNERVLTSTSSR